MEKGVVCQIGNNFTQMIEEKLFCENPEEGTETLQEPDNCRHFSDIVSQ